MGETDDLMSCGMQMACERGTNISTSGNNDHDREGVLGGAVGLVVGEEAVDDALNVVLDRTGLEGLVDEGAADPVTEEEALVGLFVVHDVGFKEDDGAAVEAIGEEVAGEEIGAVGDGEGIGSGVGVGGQARAGREAGSEGFGEGDFLFVDAREEAGEHFEAGVVIGEFSGGVTAVDEEVSVIDGGVLRGGSVSPGFGVEVEAEDEVRFDFLIDPVGSGVDFSDTVEEFFALPLDGEEFGFALDALVAVGRVGESGLFEGLDGGEAMIGRFGFGDGGGLVANESDVSSEGFEAGREDAGGEEGEIAFLNGFTGIEAEVAFFHDAIAAADVARVDGDMDVAQRWAVSERGEFGGAAPEARRRGFSLDSAGKRDGDGRVYRVAGLDFDAIGSDDPGGGIVSGLEVDGLQGVGEVRVAESAGVSGEGVPVRRGAQRGGLGAEAGHQSQQAEGGEP